MHNSGIWFPGIGKKSPDKSISLKVREIKVSLFLSISIGMVWGCGKNGWVLYGQKGVEGGSGAQVRGRPWLGWMGGVKVALGNRGMMVEAAQQCAKDRREIHQCPCGYLTDWASRNHFVWPYVFPDCPPVLWWLSPGEGWDAVTWCGWDKL